jgi:hypothetical protein
MAVGAGCIFNSPPILDRSTGKRDNGDMLGSIRSLTIDIGVAPSCTVEFTTDPVERLGIGPTMYLSGTEHTILQTNNILAVTGMNTNPQNNDFADDSANAILTDLAYFDCYDGNKATGQIESRDCSCGPYAVTVFERGTETLIFDPAYVNASQNVWRGTINVTSATLGECVITLADDNQFDDTGEYVVIFSDRADSNIQSCQTDLYGWLGKKNNKVEDSTATDHPAILTRA